MGGSRAGGGRAGASKAQPCGEHWLPPGAGQESRNGIRPWNLQGSQPRHSLGFQRVPCSREMAPCLSEGNAGFPVVDFSWLRRGEQGLCTDSKTRFGSWIPAPLS